MAGGFGVGRWMREMWLHVNLRAPWCRSWKVDERAVVTCGYRGVSGKRLN